MRVHANQVNPNAQLDAMYAAQKAASKQEAARTRKKLLESGAEIRAEEEPCMVHLGSAEEKNERSRDRRPPLSDSRTLQNSKDKEEDAEDQISTSATSITEWA